MVQSSAVLTAVAIFTICPAIKADAAPTDDSKITTIHSESSFESAEIPADEDVVERQIFQAVSISSDFCMESDDAPAEPYEQQEAVKITAQEPGTAVWQTEDESSKKETSKSTWKGPVINAHNGTVMGPSGKETYYNLPMNGVIHIMRSKGYSEKEYPYWVREDGCKMFGPYIMVAANLSIRPKGTILECSRGTAMVVDTGGFAKENPTQLDIATDW